MEWHELKFPDDVDPLDVPAALRTEVEAIYQRTGFPEGFCVFQEIDHEFSSVIYFSPVATRHCLDDGLFATYRKIHPCKKPARSGKPIITVVGDDDECQRMLGGPPLWYAE